MILTKFKYKSNDWELKEINFSPLNLIVGKNAVGKSKTLKALSEVLLFIQNEFSTDSVRLITNFKCELTLVSKHKYIYSFAISDGKIEEESLYVDDIELIERKNGLAKLKGETINPPENSLILQSRRDTEKFPEFEDILTWVDHTSGFMFSSPNSNRIVNQDSFLLKGSYAPSDLYEGLTKKDIEDIKVLLKELDYNIEDISKIDLTKEYKLITIKEAGVKTVLFNSLLSNGMYRVIYLLLYMFYMSNVKGAKCILIDDLGEGLDFDRSTKLSSILFDYCKKHDIQLIVTSNDSFLLNNVELKYWIILQREGSVVSNISNVKNPDLFRKFKFTGLNNFELIGTDFIDRYFENKDK